MAVDMHEGESAAEAGGADGVALFRALEPALGGDLAEMLRILPPDIEATLRRHDELGTLLEIVLDLGRLPEARFAAGDAYLGNREVTVEDLRYITQRVSPFGDDNRSGIERTLHRISAILNRAGEVVGVTCRVGRAIHGSAKVIEDLAVSGNSVLLVGRPGVGKTTVPAGARQSPRRLRPQAGGDCRHVQRDCGGRGHPAPGHRQGAAHAGLDAGAPARGDDRGGGEPHAAGDHRRRDGDGARGGRGEDDCRAGRAAHRDRSRQYAGEPAGQPDAVRFGGRGADRHAGR